MELFCGICLDFMCELWYNYTNGIFNPKLDWEVEANEKNTHGIEGEAVTSREAND